MSKEKIQENSAEKSDVAKREEEVLTFWQKHKIFEKTLEKESPNGEFVFYDGPPFATGTPHHGHIIGSTTKDVVGRYKTMQGYHVPRTWGWDCHGLPIENIAEKGLDISGRDAIEKMGIDTFNEYARSRVLGFVDAWRDTVARIGRWVDFDNSYKTMDNEYIESVWWALKQMNEKGFLYEGERVLPYCPRCETPIANSEIAMDNSYKDIKDISITAKFELENEPGTYILAWTTTPWTTPGNVALAVGGDIDYVKVEAEGEKYILAKERLADVMGEREYEVVEEIKGIDLVGKKYKPLFDYFSRDTKLENRENAWQIYAGDFVTTESGTGVVHTAPAFGEDDMELAKKENLPTIKHVDRAGKFTGEVSDFVDMSVKPKDNHQVTDIEIIKHLAHKNLLFSKEKIEHSYPHCHRCETPLFYYALPAWFLNIQKVKQKMIQQNEQITWIPEHLKHGRFKHVLETAPDWNISRNRYWASPLPIWKCECGVFKVVGSVEELRELANEDVPNIKDIDLHRPHIDKYTINCSDCGKRTKRVPEVFDCWFESGSMPFASNHYPYENTDIFDPNKGVGFPADFIAEYIPQTRTWFYYMLAVSTMLFDETSFLNVVTTGNVLAEDGRKMSKSLQNYTDPQEIFDMYGVDALRMYLLTSPVMHGDDMEFHDRGVAELMRKVIIRLANVCSFYKIYAVPLKPITYNLKPSKNILDVWIISRLNQLLEETTDAMEKYELERATRPIISFIDDLSTWYLRRSRDRLKGDNKEDKEHALQTMQYTFIELSKIMAPFTPFFADWLYREVGGEKESVHLDEWRNLESRKQRKENGVIKEMEEVRRIVSLALEARAKEGIKVRQPLASLLLKTEVDEQLLPLIRDEVNVKEIISGQTISEDIKFDFTITSELKEEGYARELMRNIQEFRKKAGLTPQDEISLTIHTNKKGEVLVQKFEKDISNTASIKNIEFSKTEGKEVVIGEYVFVIKLRVTS